MQLWQGIIGTVVRVAGEYDRQWQQRQRVLNTLLVVLFVFRLVFAPDRQGYALTLAELWEQCRRLEVALPQPQPVSASSICAARAKIHADVFRRISAWPTILHDDFRIISDANLVIIQIVSCRRELGARGLTEAAGSGKFPSGGTDDSDLFCFAADLQLNRGLDGSAVGWQGVVRSGTVFCRSRLRGLAGPVGSGVGIAVAGRSSL